jgi:hypothetical protein
LTAGTDLQGKLTFWGKPLLTDDEIRDWRTRLEALKTFTEGLTPYNTVGKLKNLRIGSDDIDAQKKNLEVLAAVEKLLDLVTELGSTAAYLSQAEMVLSSDHAWVKQAQSARKDILDKLALDRNAQHAAEYRQTLAQLKKDYLTAYIAQHSKARLGVAEDKTKSALRKDSASGRHAGPGRHRTDAHQPAHRLRRQARQAQELRVAGGVGAVCQPLLPALQLPPGQRARRLPAGSQCAQATG